MAGLPSAAFQSLYRKQADSAGVMPFDRFMELALYDSVLGYYRAPRARVGTGEGTDFYTAESSTSLFGELVSASCEALLLSQGVPAADFDFVEIGAEPGTGLLEGLKHPFAAYRCLRLGQKLELPERCIVFSNELFDAQPCRRFLRRNSAWLELGVGERDAALVEIEMPHLVSEPWLPSEAPEGCRFDAPRASVALAETLVRPS
jgi:SAM-dependent MidA family methyltransferase